MDEAADFGVERLGVEGEGGGLAPVVAAEVGEEGVALGGADRAVEQQGDEVIDQLLGGGEVLAGQQPGGVEDDGVVGGRLPRGRDAVGEVGALQQRAGADPAEAARALQTDRANLYRRMKRLGLS